MHKSSNLVSGLRHPHFGAKNPPSSNRGQSSRFSVPANRNVILLPFRVSFTNFSSCFQDLLACGRDSGAGPESGQAGNGVEKTLEGLDTTTIFEEFGSRARLQPGRQAGGFCTNPGLQESRTSAAYLIADRLPSSSDFPLNLLHFSLSNPDLRHNFSFLPLHLHHHHHHTQ